MIENIIIAMLIFLIGLTVGLMISQIWKTPTIRLIIENIAIKAANYQITSLYNRTVELYNALIDMINKERGKNLSSLERQESWYEYLTVAGLKEESEDKND